MENSEENHSCDKNAGFATRALHTKLKPKEWDCSSGMMPAITTAATFVMSGPEENKDEPLYGRYGNPSRNSVEAILASLEGAKHNALCFSSGMAAVNVVLETLQSGDHVVASNQLYGGVYNLFRSGLPRMGIDITMVDIFDLNDLKKCLRSQTKLVWLEACTNPLVMLADLEATIKAVKEFNAEIIVGIDNTFLSPYILRPLEFGADLVMHSASKYLGGHADIIAGVLATSQDNLFKELKTIQRYRGAVPSAFDCYLLERSLQTLEVCTTIYCYFLLVLS